MRKILLTIEYNGKNFCGWQIQANGRAVQEVLEKQISLLLNENITLFASGRTDSGVHALGQTAHFETSSNFDIKKLAPALNFGLDKDISVLSAKEVDPNFHARYFVKKKTYLYKIYCSKIEKPLKNGLCTQVKYDLDIEKMKKASKFFLGKHDFSAFCASGNNTTDFVRTIFEIKIENVADEIHFYITGDGFLYNMVRIIVGTLIEVGKGKILSQSIPQIIASKDRKKAGETMLASGLYLYKVEY